MPLERRISEGDAADHKEVIESIVDRIHQPEGEALVAKRKIESPPDAEQNAPPVGVAVGARGGALDRPAENAEKILGINEMMLLNIDPARDQRVAFDFNRAILVRQRDIGAQEGRDLHPLRYWKHRICRRLLIAARRQGCSANHQQECCRFHIVPPDSGNGWQGPRPSSSLG